MPNHAGWGSGPNSGIHTLTPSADEQRVLERVDGLVLERRLVQRRDVPERRGSTAHSANAGDRVGERAQPARAADAQDRREHRAGEAEHEQQRGEVAEQQVLGHVRDEALVAQVPERGEAGDAEEQPGGEAQLAPQRRPGGPARASVDARRAYSTPASSGATSCERLDARGEMAEGSGITGGG